MTLADAEAVRALFDALDLMHREQVPWRFREPPTQPRDDAWFAQVIADRDQEIFVAESDRVVGFAHGRMENPPDFPSFIPERWGYLSTLYVLEEARRDGIAAALVSRAEVWAREHSATRMECNVYDFNHQAQAFFQGAGYAPLSRQLWKPIEESS